jgi:hypothetical protein
VCSAALAAMAYAQGKMKPKETAVDRAARLQRKSNDIMNKSMLKACACGMTARPDLVPQIYRILEQSGALIPGATRSSSNFLAIEARPRNESAVTFDEMASSIAYSENCDPFTPTPTRPTKANCPSLFFLLMPSRQGRWRGGATTRASVVPQGTLAPMP